MKSGDKNTVVPNVLPLYTACRRNLAGLGGEVNLGLLAAQTTKIYVEVYHSKQHQHNYQQITIVMSSVKRKALESTLQRRVRARRDDIDEVVEESSDGSAPSEEEMGASGSENGSEDESFSNEGQVSKSSLILTDTILTVSLERR